MTRSTISLIIICLTGTISFAQNGNSKYLQEAAEVRKDVWNWDKPEFKVRNVPAEYAGASKVIVARHLEVNADSKRKLKVGLFLAAYRELMLTETVREAVKVNDKTAVEEYSEIAYTQLERKSGMLMDKTTIVYLGVRVIKPDGSMKEINADDIVLTKDQKKDKEAKIAIPDLQVGDIIDYFITKQTSMSQLNSLPDYTFTFFDVAPIMHCSMHIEVGKKYAVEYRCYNGAPDFKVSKTEDDGNELSVEKSNIAQVSAGRLWTAPYRQLPVVRVNIILGYKGMFASRMNARTPGTVYKNQSSDEFVEDKLREVAFSKTTTKYRFDLGQPTQDYYRALRKNRNNISQDSLEKELFYIFRFYNFFEQRGVEDVERLANLPHVTFNENMATYLLGEFFKANEVDNSLIYYTLNTGPRINEILSTEDLNNIIMTQQSQSFYGLSNIFATPAYLPYYAENTRKAISVNTGSPRVVSYSNFLTGTKDIPASNASENTRIEKLNVVLNPATTKLHVQRQSILRGHYKSDEQQRLILFEDYYNSERKYFNDDKSLVERLSERRKTKALAEELQSVFTNARNNNKNSFTEEARGWFDVEVSDIKNYKVENLGVRHTSPDFIYSAEFDLDGMIKKAGINYIVDIGKLLGSPLKLEGDMRKRTLDVYQPFARSLQYQISFTIPDGYTAEGVSALNKKVENSAGAFICEATTTDKAVTLNIKKIYKNQFEPVANWDKMLSFVDAASEWSDSRILFKKK